jgi:hypothetical protein
MVYNILYTNPWVTENNYLSIIQTHVKQQKLGRLLAHALNSDTSWALSALHKCPIAFSKLDVANLDLSTTTLWLRLSSHYELHEDLALAISYELVRHALSWAEDRSRHAQVDMRWDGIILCVAARMSIYRLDDADEFVCLHLVGEFACII